MRAEETESEDDEVDEEINPHESPEKEILWAAVKGEVDVIRRLLQANPTLVSVKDRDGYTPLHRACYENHSQAVEVLLQNQADVCALTNEKWQPLHSAAKWNSAESVSLLLDWGADVNAATASGLTPLHLAASNSKAHATLAILLSHPLVDAQILSSTCEMALEIAQRCGPYAKLFDMIHPALTEI